MKFDFLPEQTEKPKKETKKQAEKQAEKPVIETEYDLPNENELPKQFIWLKKNGLYDAKLEKALGKNLDDYIHSATNEKALDCFYVLLKTGEGFQPLRYFGYTVWDDLVLSDEKLDGYKLWLEIFNECNGTSFCVYYPNEPKQNEKIKVVINSTWLKGFVYWKHGKEGLFNEKIEPLLVLDDFFFGLDCHDLGLDLDGIKDYMTKTGMFPFVNSNKKSQ